MRPSCEKVVKAFLLVLRPTKSPKGGKKIDGGIFYEPSRSQIVTQKRKTSFHELFGAPFVMISHILRPYLYRRTEMSQKCTRINFSHFGIRASEDKAWPKDVSKRIQIILPLIKIIWKHEIVLIFVQTTNYLLDIYNVPYMLNLMHSNSWRQWNLLWSTFMHSGIIV